MTSYLKSNLDKDEGLEKDNTKDDQAIQIYLNTG